MASKHQSVNFFKEKSSGKRKKQLAVARSCKKRSMVGKTMEHNTEATGPPDRDVYTNGG